ncbi:MAG TPA: chemotaxis protein CheE [Caulobacteraceae bacterium]
MFRVPNKLRNKILKAGGMRAIEALTKGKQALDDLREPSLAQIDGLIAEIVRVYGRANRMGDEDLQELYMLASRIIDCAAPVPELEIDRAAFHLCELTDRCLGLQRWDWPSIDVHIDALQLLRMDQGKLPAEARAQIFLGLKKIHNRLPKPDFEGAVPDQAPV